MAQGRDSHVLAEAILDGLLDPLRRDRIALAVLRALGNDDDRVPAPGGPAFAQFLAHWRLPALLGGKLGNEHVVAAAGYGAHQRQIAASPSHHFDDERALVRGRRRGNRVDRLNDPVKGGIGSHGHVASDQVVVDRPDDAGQVQARMGVRLLARDLAPLDQLVEKTGPLRPKLVGARERAVAADGHHPVDSLGHQVPDSRAHAVAFPKGVASRRPNGGSALVEDPRDVRPRHLAYEAPSLDGALPSLHDRVGHGALVEGCAHDRPHDGVHSLGVAARGEDGDLPRLARRWLVHGDSFCALLAVFADWPARRPLPLLTFSGRMPRAAGPRNSLDLWVKCRNSVAELFQSAAI